jgi:hypothetical protein
VVINGSPSRTQFLPKRQDDSGVVAEECSGLYQGRGWPSANPDLNARDCKLWAVLKDMACQRRHNNLTSLKTCLVKAAAETPLETARAAIAEWPERLKACVDAEGGHFKWYYYK